MTTSNNKYERLTPSTVSEAISNTDAHPAYASRLCELENKIESGELKFTLPKFYGKPDPNDTKNNASFEDAQIFENLGIAFANVLSQLNEEKEEDATK